MVHENWNRFYDPSIGRYLQPEPLQQDPEYLRFAAAMGHSVPVYAYALDNPLFFTDETGNAIDQTCWLKCMEETDPLSDTCKASSLPFGPLPKLPSWYRPGASPFTSIWRYINIGSRWLGIGPAVSGPEAKMLGRGGGAVTIGLGTFYWGLMGACASACSGP